MKAQPRMPMTTARGKMKDTLPRMGSVMWGRASTEAELARLPQITWVSEVVKPVANMFRPMPQMTWSMWYCTHKTPWSRA